jgi:hypothetical protein
MKNVISDWNALPEEEKADYKKEQIAWREQQENSCVKKVGRAAAADANATLNALCGMVSIITQFFNQEFLTYLRP